jgi:5-methylcytosine-specific restriction endonuclease McrA
MAKDSRLGGRTRQNLNAKIRARHQPCPLCGFPIDPTLRRTGSPHPLSSVIDEWYPRSLGGPVDETNCVDAHRCCNAIKGAHWPVTQDMRDRCRREVEALLGLEEPPPLTFW